jgi:predicted nucleic acid-binding protein
VDASVVTSWLIVEELTQKSRALRGRWLDLGEALVAPTLLVPEVTSALRKAVYQGRATLAVGLDALRLFAAAPIEYYEMPPYSEAAWDWGRRLNTPRLYDMYYLALADALDCDLWVVEKKLVNIVGSNSRRVRWVGDT